MGGAAEKREKKQVHINNFSFPKAYQRTRDPYKKPQ
jgi:hypothetical protein